MMATSTKCIELRAIRARQLTRDDYTLVLVRTRRARYYFFDTEKKNYTYKNNIFSSKRYCDKDCTRVMTGGRVAQREKRQIDHDNGRNRNGRDYYFIFNFFPFLIATVHCTTTVHDVLYI